MIIWDRDGVITIELAAGSADLKVTEDGLTCLQVIENVAKAYGKEVPDIVIEDWMTPEQAAMYAADALGIRYWLLDRAG